MKEFSSFTFDKLSYFYNKLLGKFALKSHKHTKSEITDFPTIPTKTSQLTNDSGFKTTDTNTKYTLSKSGSTIKLTGTDGSEQSVTDSNTTYGNMKGATTSAAGGAGLVPAPVAGASTRYLRSDGTWSVPPDTNTTYADATTSVHGLMTAGDKTKLNGIESGANKTVVDSTLSSTSTNPVQNKAINTEITSLKNLVGTSSVTSQINTAFASKKGKSNGLAELDANGKVPSSQLPSYVDDVLEYNGKANFPETGESGKIYVDTATNLTYRWSGSAYIEISPSIALGTTESTAYRGDYGNIAYTHATAKGSAFKSGLYKITTNDQGHVTAATAVTKSDITALGIPGQDTNTTYGNATTSAAGLMSSSDKSKLDGIAAGADKTIVDTALSSTSVNPVQNKVVNSAIADLKTKVGDTAVSTQITNATNNFIKGLSVSGQTITYTKGNGTTGTISTQDNRTRQTLSSANTNMPILMASRANTDSTANVDDIAYRSNNIYGNPSTGKFTAKSYSIGAKAEIQYDDTNKCLNFVFN